MRNARGNEFCVNRPAAAAAGSRHALLYLVQVRVVERESQKLMRRQ